MIRIAALLTLLVSASAWAAEPVRIGITTILSGPYADRGQSEQYGAQLALDQINEAGGLLGRPVEAFYADNACDPAIGVPATKRLIEQVHVPVMIGALCTPVTHAIMPLVAEAKVPLIIATSAGQDFVDASGVGGNPYAFKTIGSEIDIARGLIKYLQAQGVSSIAIIGDDNGFSRSNVMGFARVAGEMGLHVTIAEIVPEGTKDLTAILAKLREGSPDRILSVLGPSEAALFHAYAASDWTAPLTGRINLASALAQIPPERLAKATSVSVFTPIDPKPGVQSFVAAYRAHYGLTPTQRSFYVFEAVLLAADAIKRAGNDTPEAIESALKTTQMPSLRGGSYAVDDHNHSHLPLSIGGVVDGKVAVVATE